MAKTFEEVWAEKEREGYRYGSDALELVRFGWDLAHQANADLKRGSQIVPGTGKTYDEIAQQVRALPGDPK